MTRPADEVAGRPRIVAWVVKGTTAAAHGREQERLAGIPRSSRNTSLLAKGGSGTWELLADSGAIWATRRRNSITVFGQNYEIRHVMKSKRRNFILDRVLRNELVDAEGSTVLSWTGGHYKGNAGAVLSKGGRNYAFPVRGSKYNAKTFMPAVEVGGSGSPIARFRLTCGWYRAAQGRNPRPVEVVVSPDSLPDHQMALVVAVASPWLRSWFDSPGSG